MTLVLCSVAVALMAGLGMFATGSFNGSGLGETRNMRRRHRTRRERGRTAPVIVEPGEPTHHGHGEYGETEEERRRREEDQLEEKEREEEDRLDEERRKEEDRIEERRKEQDKIEEERRKLEHHDR